MSERECPFVPRHNPIECPYCGSRRVNAEYGGEYGTIVHCDKCGYHGVPDPSLLGGDQGDSQSWDPAKILRSLGLYPEDEGPQSGGGASDEG